MLISKIHKWFGYATLLLWTARHWYKHVGSVYFCKCTNQLLSKTLINLSRKPIGPLHLCLCPSSTWSLI